MTAPSWRDLFDEAAARLDDLDARRIVEEVSGLEGAELLVGLDSPATSGGVAAFDQMVQRRASGEPLQYVLGRWSFRTLDLAVDRRVLIPRPETEVLAGLALDELRRQDTGGPLLAVDLGTGSGAIGLSLAAENPRTEVICTDISPDALAVARANLAGLGRPATRVRLEQGYWYEALPSECEGGVAVLVANPPYVGADEKLPAVVADYEPAGALVAGPTGMEAAEVIIGGAPPWLAPGGALVVELAPHQLSQAAVLAGEAFGTVEIAQDLAGRDRVLIAR